MKTEYCVEVDTATSRSPSPDDRNIYREREQSTTAYASELYTLHLLNINLLRTFPCTQPLSIGKLQKKKKVLRKIY